METVRLTLAALCLASLLACTSDKKSTQVSDSAITAPVDTLGGDTTRLNPIGDTVKTNIDTAK